MLRRRYGSSVLPWQEMEYLQREMNRLFSTVSRDIGSSIAPAYPAMNIWANKDGAIITAELPGIEPDDIEITVEGDNLMLSGERKPEEMAEGDVYHRRERGCGKFSRSIQLPFSVEADKVDASFKNGVLSIKAPRPEQEKPRKISIKVG